MSVIEHREENTTSSAEARPALSRYLIVGGVSLGVWLTIMLAWMSRTA
ncbi:MAG: hypothetical protein ACE366_23240 [Bradymonadia bacterium]